MSQMLKEVPSDVAPKKMRVWEKELMDRTDISEAEKQEKKREMTQYYVNHKSAKKNAFVEDTVTTPTVEGGPDFIEDTKSQYTRDPVVDERINDAKRISKGDYTPEFEAGVITKAIPTLSAMLSRNFNLNRFLDNIRIKVGDSWSPVGKYVE